MDRYDVADLVRLIATNWPVAPLQDYAPEYSRQVALEADMEPGRGGRPPSHARPSCPRGRAWPGSP